MSLRASLTSENFSFTSWHYQRARHTKSFCSQLAELFSALLHSTTISASSPTLSQKEGRKNWKPKTTDGIIMKEQARVHYWDSQCLISFVPASRSPHHVGEDYMWAFWGHRNKNDKPGKQARLMQEWARNSGNLLARPSLIGRPHHCLNNRLLRGKRICLSWSLGNSSHVFASLSIFLVQFNTHSTVKSWHNQYLSDRGEELHSQCVPKLHYLLWCLRVILERKFTVQQLKSRIYSQYFL